MLLVSISVLSENTSSARRRNEPKDSVRIAVFGGSLSVNPPSQAAKNEWRQKLTARVTDYGVGGAGFSSLQGHSLQIQACEASADHDIYILWASTNDFKNSRECGTWSDYTQEDGFDESKLTTQCGGINYCIKTILEKNPHARILFFTPLRFFSDPSGSSPFDKDVNATGKTFAEYVEAQIDCCRHYGIPVLDQFSLQGVNELNYKYFYKADKLHMTEEGYRFIAPLQVSFMARFL